MFPGPSAQLIRALATMPTGPLSQHVSPYMHVFFVAIAPHIFAAVKPTLARHSTVPSQLKAIDCVTTRKKKWPSKRIRVLAAQRRKESVGNAFLLRFICMYLEQASLMFLSPFPLAESAPSGVTLVSTWLALEEMVSRYGRICKSFVSLK